MSFSIKGTVHEVGQVQQVTDSFSKRELIVAYAENPQFVEYIKVEATNERTSIFDNLQVGEEVEVSVNLRGRPWTNRDGVTVYFNTIVAWKVVKQNGGTTQAPRAATPPAAAAAVPPPVDITADDSDKLPF